MPLQPVLPNFQFSKWGLDFIGPINPPYFVGKILYLQQHIYLLNAPKLYHSSDAGASQARKVEDKWMRTSAYFEDILNFKRMAH
jgi:hypothetical protein